MSEFDEAEIYRSILESLLTGVCVVDMQKRILLWSEGAERISGHPRHEVIGHCCVGEALLHCDQQRCGKCKEDCPLEQAIKTGHATEALCYLYHKDGHEIPVRVRAVPVRNAHGSIVGAVETFEGQQAAPAEREDDLRFAGSVDDISGVASHVMMQSHLRETLATFSELHVPFGVLCLRLEGLEDFRARYGPEAAACLLRAVGSTLESSLWRTDYVGRWNDDQFLVIVNGCSEDALYAVAERVRRMLASHGIEWWGERRSLPVSVGRAAAQPGETMQSLTDRARKSLDAASDMRTRAEASGSQPSGS